jgi:mannosyl-3-phosphoglycerate phosphatase
MKGFLVITDLDGTLLSAESYDWAPARPALEQLQQSGIPVIIASSKTRAEIEMWRRRLGNRDPFLCENGGAVYIPREGARYSVPDALVVEGYDRLEFGVPYRLLRTALGDLAVRLGVELRGFGDMTAPEIADRTGLSGEDLHLALRREYDEPFIAARDLSAQEEERLAAEAASMGLRVTAGGRFRHLHGVHDKGLAVTRLKSLYSLKGEPVPVMALGDGPNDRELLLAADRPVVVARPDGSHAPELRTVRGARFTTAPGPEGFNEAVLEYLRHPW